MNRTPSLSPAQRAYLVEFDRLLSSGQNARTVRRSMSARLADVRAEVAR